MKTFGTYGPVNPEENYVVSRAEELANFHQAASNKDDISLSSHLGKQAKPRSSNGHLKHSQLILQKPIFQLKSILKYTKTILRPIFTPHSIKGFMRRSHGFSKDAASCLPKL